MTFTRRTIPRWILAGAATVAGTIGLAAVPVSSSADQSLGALHSRLGAVQAHEQSLASSISSLSRLISSLDSQITLVETREAAVRADLAADRAKLQKVQASLTRERRLLALLRARLARARMLLSRQLVSNYEQSKPNLVSVVLESNGFNDLLDKLTLPARRAGAAADDHLDHPAGQGPGRRRRHAPGRARGDRQADHGRDRASASARSPA